MWVAGKVLSLHLKLLDIDHPLAFEQSKLRQIEDHALIYPSRPKRSKNPIRCSLYKGVSPPPSGQKFSADTKLHELAQQRGKLGSL